MPEPDINNTPWSAPTGGYFADDSAGFFDGLWNVATGVFDRATDWIESDRAWDYRKWLAENGYIDSTQIGGTPTGVNAGAGNWGATGTGMPMSTLLLYGGGAALLIYLAMRASK